MSALGYSVRRTKQWPLDESAVKAFQNTLHKASMPKAADEFALLLQFYHQEWICPNPVALVDSNELDQLSIMLRMLYLTEDKTMVTSAQWLEWVDRVKYSLTEEALRTGPRDRSLYLAARWLAIGFWLLDILKVPESVEFYLVDAIKKVRARVTDRHGPFLMPNKIDRFLGILERDECDPDSYQGAEFSGPCMRFPESDRFQKWQFFRIDPYTQRVDGDLIVAHESHFQDWPTWREVEVDQACLSPRLFRISDLPDDSGLPPRTRLFSGPSLPTLASKGDSEGEGCFQCGAAVTDEDARRACLATLFDMGSSPRIVSLPSPIVREIVDYSRDPADTQKLTCGHFFHEACLKRWLEFCPSCPTCRTSIPPSREQREAHYRKHCPAVLEAKQKGIESGEYQRAKEEQRRLAQFVTEKLQELADTMQRAAKAKEPSASPSPPTSSCPDTNTP